MDLDDPRIQTIIDEHREWLATYPDQYAKHWEDLFVQDSWSAAAEAWTRGLLVTRVREIEPYDKPNIGGPDFLCSARTDGTQFFVEVTNLDNDALSRRTGLPESADDWKGGSVGSLDRQLLGKRLKKRKQIARLSGPVVLAITAFHETATLVHFGKGGVRRLFVPLMERQFTVPRGHTGDQHISREDPMFECEFFYKSGDSPETYKSACPELSAALLCGIPWRYSEAEPFVDLALNPTARHPFNPKWLNEVRCWRLQDDWETSDPCQWKIRACGDSV
jgi:hypothetical protein